MKKRNLSLLILLLIPFIMDAQQALTLDSCRSLALSNNNQLKISEKEVQIAQWKRKSALTNYYPKISALGTYMHNQKEVSLLNKDQKDALQNLGTNAGAPIKSLGNILGTQFPGLSPYLDNINEQLDRFIFSRLDQFGGNIVDKLRTDTRNIYAGAVTVTQPIFMGGKIRAYDNITKYSLQIAENKNKLTEQDIILETDKTYWLVVSLSNKKKLADSYLHLLERMKDDVDKMIKEGVATKADGLTVMVKVNEAEMKQAKAENGLNLAKMALCQICGIDLDPSILLADENADDLPVDIIPMEYDSEFALQNRPEIISLNLASKAIKQKVTIERSEFLPKIALTGNYIVTNPSTFNGFENKFRGMWNVGVQLKIPICSWGEGIYKVNIAKAETEIIDYKLTEAKEKITLQVSQARFKLNEALRQLKMASRNKERAEENLRYADIGFKEGVISQSQLLEAQTVWFNAQSEQIDAQIEVKLSQISLQKVLGTLGVN